MIKIAFYKGEGNLINRIVRRWTSSPYSHAELVLPNEITWISISPLLTGKVSARSIDDVENLQDWDFLSFYPFKEFVKNCGFEPHHLIGYHFY